MISFLMAGLLMAAPVPVLESRESVVAVYENNDFICSGFAVSPRLVYTAAHCVKRGTSTYTIRLPDRNERVEVKILSRLYSSSIDQALLLVKDESVSLKPLYLCKEFPTPGTPLWNWSHPLGLDLVLRTGIYSGPVRGITPLAGVLLRTHLTSINVDLGSSGSPIVTAEGCYVGMLVFRMSTGLKLDGAVFRRIE